MHVKKYLITGLLVWFPLAITFWVLLWLVGLLDGIFGGVLTGLSAVTSNATGVQLELLRHRPGLGVVLEAGDIPTLYGEDQARYLVACDAAAAQRLEAAAAKAGVPIVRVGAFGGTAVSLGGDSAPMADLSALYRSAFAKAVG